MKIETFYSKLVILLCTFLFIYIVTPSYIAFSIGFIYISLDRLILLCLMAFWLFGLFSSKTVRETLRKRINTNKTITVMLLLFLLSQWISVIFSTDQVTSFKQILNFFIYVFFVYLITLSIPFNRTHIIKIGRYILSACLILIVISIIELITNNNPFSIFLENTTMTEYQQARLESKVRGGERRIQASFSNPLGYGQFILMIIPILLYFKKFYFNKNTLTNIIIISFIIFTFFIRSRAVTLILIGTIVYLVYHELFINKRNKRTKPIIIIGVFFTFFIILLQQDLISQSVGVLFENKDLLSDSNRMDQVTSAIPLIDKSTFFGYGFGRGAEILDFGSLDGSPTIDNYFLTLILNSGLVGFIIFTLFYLNVIYKYFKVNKRNKLIITALIFFLINLFTLSITENHTIFYFFLAFLLVVDEKQNYIC